MNFLKDPPFPPSFIQSYSDITYDAIPTPEVYDLFENINSEECIDYAFKRSNKLPYVIDGMNVHSFVDSNLTFIMVANNKVESWAIFRHHANIRYHLHYLKYFECNSIDTFCKIIKLCKENFNWTIQGNFDKFNKDHIIFNYKMPTFALFPKVVNITTHKELQITDQRVYDFDKELKHDNINWTIEMNDKYRNIYNDEMPEKFQILTHILYAWDEQDRK